MKIPYFEPDHNCDTVENNFPASETLNLNWKLPKRTSERCRKRFPYHQKNHLDGDGIHQPVHPGFFEHIHAKKKFAQGRGRNSLLTVMKHYVFERFLKNCLNSFFSANEKKKEEKRKRRNRRYIS